MGFRKLFTSLFLTFLCNCRVNKTIGIDEKEIEGLVDDMGSMTTEEDQECADFVETEIKQIVEAFEKVRI
jgi:hypothetical protein